MNTKHIDAFNGSIRNITPNEEVQFLGARIAGFEYLHCDEFIIGVAGTFVTYSEFNDGIESRYLPSCHVFEFHGDDERYAMEILETYPLVDLKGQIEIQEWRNNDQKVLLPVLIVKEIKGRMTKHHEALYFMRRYSLAPDDSIKRLSQLYQSQELERIISSHKFMPSKRSYQNMRDGGVYE